MSGNQKIIKEFANGVYPYGFVSAVESDSTPPGFDEDIVRTISAKKSELQVRLDWRLHGYRHWRSLERSAGEPRWANVRYPPAIDWRTWTPRSSGPSRRLAK
jgi:Fe-S cluster assembly protein SufB